jgi:hypothetical protein
VSQAAFVAAAVVFSEIQQVTVEAMARCNDGNEPSGRLFCIRDPS